MEKVIINSTLTTWLASGLFSLGIKENLLEILVIVLISLLIAGIQFGIAKIRDYVSKSKLEEDIKGDLNASLEVLEDNLIDAIEQKKQEVITNGKGKEHKGDNQGTGGNVNDRGTET